MGREVIPWRGMVGLGAFMVAVGGFAPGALTAQASDEVRRPVPAPAAAR